MPADEHPFLFNSLGSKRPTTARKAHIRRLYDVLQVCIQRHDWQRAQRVWAVLARCREVDWKAMWSTSVLLLHEDGDRSAGEVQSNAERVRFLSVMMRQHPDERESILKELVLRLIQAGLYRQAMEELDLYLPSYPYQDNPALHTYAGLIALFLAQPSGAISEETMYGQRWDASLIRDAQAHLERARAIDPSNVVAAAFLEQLSGGAPPAVNRDTPDSDDDGMDIDGSPKERKRVRA